MRLGVGRQPRRGDDETRQRDDKRSEQLRSEQDFMAFL